MATDLKKLCYDDPEFVCECYEDRVKKKFLTKKWCNILLHDGIWKDCRFGKEWKEPEIKFEGD